MSSSKAYLREAEAKRLLLESDLCGDGKWVSREVEALINTIRA
jgi:hypothetical protein